MSDSKKKMIYVIGHRNPDTDSICSAISLARLKNILKKKQDNPIYISASYAENQPKNVCYIAARCGHLNQETRYVLEKFGVKAPVYMDDARPQLSDIDYSQAECVKGDISLKQAWQIMRQINKSTLAVTDQQKKLRGIISTGDIARSYMAVFDNAILGKAHTSVSNILHTLEGTLLVGNPDMKITGGKVVTTAANIEIIKEHIDEGDVVILGNRYEAQLCAIEQKAAVVIVCDGANVSRTIRKIAADNGCVIICTNYDAYTVARHINVSMPIAHFMTTENLMTFDEDSYVDDIREIITKERFRDFPIVTADQRYVGMISRRNLIDMEKKGFILVDHNEQDQAIEGIHQAEVLEIVDHHKLGTIETVKPVVVRNQPVGCTATIIYQMYVENQIEIPQDIAGLLCSAIVSDTLLFRSPTCTPIDRVVALKLAEIAGIDIEAHAIAMFDAGSDLKSRTMEEIFYQDFKKFKSGDTTFGVGQITSMNAAELQQLKDKMKPLLEELKEKENMDMLFFLMTDILSENSILIYHGKNAEALIAQGFHKEAQNDETILEGVVSRKKQFVPVLMNMLMV